MSDNRSYCKSLNVSPISLGPTTLKVFFSVPLGIRIFTDLHIKRFIVLLWPSWQLYQKSHTNTTFEFQSSPTQNDHNVAWNIEKHSLCRPEEKDFTIEVTDETLCIVFTRKTISRCFHELIFLGTIIFLHTKIFKKSYTDWERLIRSHSSARFCFELSGNSN